MKRTCKQCGKEFFLSRSEVDFYNKKNLSLPKRCKECREANKAEKKNNAVDNTSADDRKSTASDYTYPIKKNKPKIGAIIAVAVIIVFLLGIGVSKLIDGTVSGNYDESGTSAEVETSAENIEVDTGKVETSTDNIEVDTGDVSTNTEDTDLGKPEADIVVETSTADSEKIEVVVSDTDAPAHVDGNETVAEADNSDIIVENNDTSKQDAYRFRNKKLLEQHFEKHGIDMGFNSAADYEAAASAVITNPDALSKTEKEDGDMVYYVENTNEFVVLSTDGYIRTYFLPDAGKKYYDKQ